ncbi:MAG: vitamin K epoxide reductase family protein [archaeon]
MKAIHIIILLSLLGFVISLFSFSHLNAAVCPVGGCESVQQSTYGYAFGLPNSLIGIAGFGILFVLAFVARSRKSEVLFAFLAAGCVLAGLLALWFLFVQAVLLRTFCTLCLVADAAGVCLLILGIRLAVRALSRQ